MANIFSAVTKVDPSFTEPELIITTAQASGYMDALADRKPRVKLGEDDFFVYMHTLDLRTQVAAAQSAANLLPSATITANYIQTPTYLLRVRAEYDHHDTAAAGRWNVALPEAQRLAMRQGIFQYMRVMGLYGANASNGEGILNTAGATATTLPADSYGNSTVITYDAGEFAVWLLQQVGALLSGTYQLGQAVRVQILAPQRILAQWQLAGIVQLTSYQRSGAGSATTAAAVKEIMAAANYEIEFAADDTLIGKGAGGTDAVVMNVPEIVVPDMPGVNTNVFDTLGPSMKATTLQYASMAAPMEITTPLPGGAVDVVAEMRATSGWNFRPQSVYILSMQYS